MEPQAKQGFNAVAESFFASLKKERGFDADYKNQNGLLFDWACKSITFRSD